MCLKLNALDMKVNEMNRLNRLQRIGVVISLLWVLGSVIYLRLFQVEQAHTAFKFSLGACYTTTQTDQDRTVCIEEAKNSYVELLSLDSVKFGDLAFGSIGPVIVGWLLIFLIIRIVRWILAGKK